MGTVEKRDRKLVLVVEDDEDSLELLQMAVEQEGHECRTARTVAEALKHCKDADFDVILLDLRLPDGFGIDVARYVHDKGAQKTAVSIVTAIPREDWDHVTYRKLGVRRVIQKPYRIEDIRDALQAV